MMNRYGICSQYVSGMGKIRDRKADLQKWIESFLQFSFEVLSPCSHYDLKKGLRALWIFFPLEMQLQVFPIFQSISGLMCAYFLSKMVETALFKQKGTQFHNYSTLSCGFVRKIFQK